MRVYDKLTIYGYGQNCFNRKPIKNNENWILCGQNIYYQLEKYGKHSVCYNKFVDSISLWRQPIKARMKQPQTAYA